MSHIKPTKAQLFNGLRRRPKYEEISQEINPDKTKVKYPDRNSKLIREDPRMTQLDGVGFFESMQDQQEATIKEQRKETTIRQIAKDNNTGMANARVIEPPKTRTPEFFDIGYDDAHLQTDEEEMAQGLEGSNIHSKTRKDKMKEKIRTRFVKIRTQETSITKPGTSEMGTNTDPPASTTIETQTDPPASTTVGTQTDPISLITNNIPSSSIKKKVKAKTKDEKVKKEREKKAIKEELKTELKTEEMNIEPEPPKPIPKPRGRSRSPKGSRGRPAKKEELKDEKEELKDEKKVKPEVKPEVRGRSRSRSTKVETKKEELKEEKEDMKMEVKPEVRGRSRTPKGPRGRPPKKEEVKEEKPKLEIKEDIKDEKVKKRAKSETKGEHKEKKIKVEPVTRVRAESEGKVTKLNNNITKDYWVNQTANEIRAQLALRGIARTAFANFKKDALVNLMIQTISESKK